MALSSLDDKILGEKVDYYCSSSEDEDDSKADSQVKSPPPVSSSNGRNTVHTGPKGVIEDWRRYKRLEHEEREKSNVQRKQLIKKLCHTCDNKSASDEIDEDLDEKDEEFLQLYNKRRIIELQKKFASRWSGLTFGKLTELTSQNYVEEIENEKRFVTIIIHIYEDSVPACEAMTGCLQILARQYGNIKFCQIRASEASLSENFLNHGLPALLAYKNNAIIGSFVQVSEALSDDFYANDVEAYLKSYGILQDKEGSDSLGSCDVDQENRIESDEDD